MQYISKSKFTKLCQCEKLLWLDTYKKYLANVNESTKDRFEYGNLIGDLAMGLFGPFQETTIKDEKGKLNINKMQEITKDLLQKKEENICEATFIYDNLVCMVDILRRVDEGYEIFEVKSSTHEKETYLDDISIQKYILMKCGLNVISSNLVIINKDYIKNGEIDINKLFKIINVDADIENKFKNMPSNIEKANYIINSSTEPSIEVGIQCFSPYECPFHDYCFKDIPSNSIIDLYGLNLKKKFDYYNKGIISYLDILNSNISLNDIQRRQIEYSNREDIYINKEEVNKFINNLKYPLYFLDFETMQPSIPLYDGTSPYEQIPFQYSLHILNEDLSLIHKEFLGDGIIDPRRGIAESIINNIPDNVDVIAYNSSFEQGKLRKLGLDNSDLRDRLDTIASNVKDLIIPFKQGYIYCGKMKNSFSIKSVLPALFPDDPECNYHSLNQVHNGEEAMTIYQQLQYMSPQERDETRHNLLKYCELDTYAMVKIFLKILSLLK